MLDFTVVPDGGEKFEVKATTRDVLLWEKAGKGRSMATLLGDISIEKMYQLAHLAARRQGLFAGTLAEFEETCELEFEETGDVDPTQLARFLGR